MASNFRSNTRTYTAGGTINANTFVKFGADSQHVVACGANERAIGIARGDASSGQSVEVDLPGGGSRLKVASTVALGKMVTSTSVGQGEKADAAGEWVGAVAYEDGVANDVIDVMVTGFQAQASD